MQGFYANKIKKAPWAFFFYSINGVCIAFVLWQSIKCMTRYIQKPKGTTVSMAKSSQVVPFPAITVCGFFEPDYLKMGGQKPRFNTTYVQDVCGLRYYGLLFDLCGFEIRKEQGKGLILGFERDSHIFVAMMITYMMENGHQMIVNVQTQHKFSSPWC